MAFQRSYSKVWWGSENQSNAGSSLTSGGYYYSSHQQQQPTQPFTGSSYHSLDYNSLKMFSGNLSRIQEVDDEQQNLSKLSWESTKHESPGSLRSQDSGFSDNDESHSTRSLGGRSSKTASPSSKSDSSRRNTDSPASTKSIVTPPTVIRRVGRSEFYSPLVSVSRRISFSGSPAATGKKQQLEMKESSNSSIPDADNYNDDNDIDGSRLFEQLDSFQLLNSTPNNMSKFYVESDGGSRSVEGDGNNEVPTVTGEDAVQTLSDIPKGKNKPKRRRRIVRTATKPLKTPTKRRTLPQKFTDDCNGDGHGGDEIENDDDGDGDGDGDNNSSFDELEEDIAELRAEHRTVPAYHNETVYLGSGDVEVLPEPYNNETVLLGALTDDTNNNSLKLTDETLTIPCQQRTSTPKVEKYQTPMDFLAPLRMPQPHHRKYTNPLLNGHPPALESWLRELRSSYDNEVMSTLQTKSIAQEAFKNLTITTNTVAKLIRQLQQRALYMQSDFERIERILTLNEPTTLHGALSSAEQLVDNIAEFTSVLERRAVFFSESRAERKRYEDNLDQIKLITKDTRYSLERQHYINLESLLDDVQVLKRYLLIALRQVFDRMVRIIVQSIEQGRCDLMLRANINMVATLTNIDYEGFASLTDAFVQNEAVRALLIVCLEHKLSSVRALALRALSTICCAPAAIAQLSASDGIEIVRDILQVQSANAGDMKRGSTERREAVSLLTQLTADWHGPDHHVAGLRDCVESIVAGLTQLVIEQTSCSQTLLLCAAALNNLSRIEVTSHYSIMSNETIFKLIETVEDKQQQQLQQQQQSQQQQNFDSCNGVSIFLYEQIVAMLHNMSLNKKCHSHLANGCIINFITSAYEMEFYKGYDSRAECDAQRRTIKAILHTLTRLVHDSNGGGLGLELLQQQRIPAVLYKFSSTIPGAGTGAGSSSNHSEHVPKPYATCHSLSRDIELLVRQLELAHKQAHQQQQQQQQQQRTYGTESSSKSKDELEGGGGANASASGLKFELTKHESFV